MSSTPPGQSGQSGQTAGPPQNARPLATARPAQADDHGDTPTVDRPAARQAPRSRRADAAVGRRLRSARRVRRWPRMARDDRKARGHAHARIRDQTPEVDSGARHATDTVGLLPGAGARKQWLDALAGPSARHAARAYTTIVSLGFSSSMNGPLSWHRRPPATRRERDPRAYVSPRQHRVQGHCLRPSTGSCTRLAWLLMPRGTALMRTLTTSPGCRRLRLAGGGR